jgi:hypothetical protein
MTKLLQFCAVCDFAFEVEPSRIKYGRGKYCSAKCQYEAIRAKPKKMLSFLCLGCGKSFERAQSVKNKGTGKFCTRECRDLHWRGPLNPNWQGLRLVKRYGSNWAKQKRAARARDKMCQHCCARDKLHVHHKTPIRLFDTPEEANDLANLITLCETCHRIEEAKYKWAKGDGFIICMSSHGAAAELAREKGML